MPQDRVTYPLVESVNVEITFFLSLDDDCFGKSTVVDLIDGCNADHVGGVRPQVAEERFVVDIAFFGESAAKIFMNCYDTLLEKLFSEYIAEP